jgi:indolepyruvate ferredoxin oxidoreductase, alpha subunit
MKGNLIKQLCQDDPGKTVVLQGNIAFAVGCVRSGIHCVDGYPGTPSTEVIDRGLSPVQDLIKVGWSVNEAVAVATAFGNTMAGEDAVVTLKIPGLFQAGDVFTSAALIRETRGALIYYIASDFTPSSTQHVIDPRYLFKSAMIPVIEPRSHQEMHEAPAMAVEMGRKYKTPVVILASGALCHSEGLLSLAEIQTREPVNVPENLRNFNVLPGLARKNYDHAVEVRMPSIAKIVEKSPLNEWIKGSGKKGVITYGASTIYVKEVKELYGADFDILSLAYTNPLPLDLLKKFHESIDGDVFIFEDGYQYLQEEIERMGKKVIGKERYSKITEWSPSLVAESMGYEVTYKKSAVPAVNRPPLICPGCPYRLFAEAVGAMKKSGRLKAVFGDIGCNALLYFMDAMDTGLAMGASDAKRQGYVISKPEMASKCISIIGDSTECHSGMDATRSGVFRNIPGIKVVLDNFCTAMTGGQPSPTSPMNYAGEGTNFNLVKALEGTGIEVMRIDAYDRKSIKTGFREAIKKAENKEFVTMVVEGLCIKKRTRPELDNTRITIDPDVCQRCDKCQVCPGTERHGEDTPDFNNLCSGCGGELPACLQMCPYKAMSIEGGEKETKQAGGKVEFPEPPEIKSVKLDKSSQPDRLSLAVRGVGGQGTLFFGRVMTEMAFLAGYGEENIVKGETHGMAQMGGPVISTFSCGSVHSPVLYPGSADALIAMESSEVLRPGFLELLKPDGMILLSDTQIVPMVVAAGDYPDEETIQKEIKGYNVIRINALQTALDIGDPTGRIANVVLIGALSKLAPFDIFPDSLWQQALTKVSPNAKIWAGNYAAFLAGRELV